MLRIPAKAHTDRSVTGAPEVHVRGILASMVACTLTLAMDATAAPPIEVGASVWIGGSWLPAEPLGVVKQAPVTNYQSIVLQADGMARWWNGTSASGYDGTAGPFDLSKDVALGMVHWGAIRSDGTVELRGFEWNTEGATSPPADLGPVQQLAAGYNFTVALRTDGAIRCFGRNNYGQCDAPTDGVFTTIASKYEHSLAVRSDGSVAGWGQNWSGQCNPPAGLSAPRGISVGWSSSGAVLTDGTILLWGNSLGTMPALGPVKQLALGAGHAVALGEDGTVTCWGSDYQGECGGVGSGQTRRRPATLPPIARIDAGNSVTAVVTTTGERIAWGFDGGRTCTPPIAFQPIRGIRQIPSSVAVALVTSHGTVAFGGYPWWGARPSFEGMSVDRLVRGSSEYLYGAILRDKRLVLTPDSASNQVPPDTLFVRDAEIASGCVVAHRLDGRIRAWPPNYQLALSLPTSLGVVDAFSADGSNAIALRTDGSVRTWGDDSWGQLDVPDDLESVRDVVCVGSGYFALLEDGNLRAWGNLGETGGIPSNLPPLETIAASNSYLSGRAKSDGNWWGWHPSSQTATQIGEKLIVEGTHFLYAMTPSVNEASPILAPIGFGTPRSHTFTQMRPAESDVTLTIAAIGDFNLSTEFATIRIDGAPLQNVFLSNANDCPQYPDQAQITIPRKTFNMHAADGSVTIRADGSNGVSATQCASGMTRFTLTYTAVPRDCNANAVNDANEIASRSTTDCNANDIPDSCDLANGTAVDLDGDGEIDDCQPDCNDNGLPDTYEIANGTVADCNSNLIIDLCETQAGAQDKDADGRIDECEIARGDFDLDGLIGGADLSGLLSLWGFENPPYGDFNEDGLVGGADLAYLLSNWGPLE